MKKVLLSGAVLALLAGCASPPSQFDGEVKQQLTEINTSLKEIAQKTRKPNSAANRGLTQKDLDEIAALPPLPDQPTAPAVKAYAAKLDEISRKRDRKSSDDAYSNAVKAIPPGFIIELAPYLNNFYFDSNIPNWLTPQDKDAVLKALPTQPNLLQCLRFIPYDDRELREPLLQILQNNNTVNGCSLSPYVDRLVSDPESKDKVEALLCQKPGLYSLAPAFAKRDGNEQIYDKLWVAYQQNKAEMPFPLVAKMLHSGKPDAVAVLIVRLQKEPKLNNYTKSVLTAHFPEWPVADNADWVIAHQNELKYNAADQKYYLQK